MPAKAKKSTKSKTTRSYKSSKHTPKSDKKIMKEHYLQTMKGGGILQGFASPGGKVPTEAQYQKSKKSPKLKAAKEAAKRQSQMKRRKSSSKSAKRPCGKKKK